MKKVLILIIGMVPVILKSQNCNAYLYYHKDTAMYKACKIAENAYRYYQYTKEYQDILDQAIEECPRFHFAYRNKSIAYLKSGDFITWKKLMDKAVSLSPSENLGYRGACRFQFFRDYKGAIADFEELERIAPQNDIGYVPGGEYHNNTAKALCYKMLGNKELAISTIEKQLSKPNYIAAMFDHLHLGVLYLETKNYQKAKEHLIKQIKIHDVSEAHFYLALISRYNEKFSEANDKFNHALKLYDSGQKMKLPYNGPIDRVYREQILKEIKKF